MKITKQFVKNALPVRPADSNKGTFGKVLCVCGSPVMMGAAVLCAKGVLSAGAGYVISAAPEELKNIIFISVPEAVVLGLKKPG